MSSAGSPIACPALIVEALDAVAPGRRFGRGARPRLRHRPDGRARPRARRAPRRRRPRAGDDREGAPARGFTTRSIRSTRSSARARTRGRLRPDPRRRHAPLPRRPSIPCALPAERRSFDGWFVFTAETIDAGRLPPAATDCAGSTRRPTSGRGPCAPQDSVSSICAARGPGARPRREAPGAHRGGGGGVTAARLSCCGFAAVLCRGGIDAAGPSRRPLPAAPNRGV